MQIQHGQGHELEFQRQVKVPLEHIKCSVSALIVPAEFFLN